MTAPCTVNPWPPRQTADLPRDQLPGLSHFGTRTVSAIRALLLVRHCSEIPIRPNSSIYFAVVQRLRRFVQVRVLAPRPTACDAVVVELRSPMQRPFHETVRRIMQMNTVLSSDRDL